MVTPAEFKFNNTISNNNVAIDDAMTSALSPTMDANLAAALSSVIVSVASSSLVINASTAAALAPLLPFRLQGFLINGNGMVNERARSGFYASTFADDTYGGPDRWYNLAQSNAFAPATGTALDASTPYYNRITQSNASAQRIGRAQIVETRNCNFASGSLVLSGKIRCSAATNIRYAILNWTGTADTVTSDVVLDWTSSTYTAGNFFLAANLEVVAVGVTSVAANTVTTIADLTGSLASFATNLIVFIWTESTQAQNVTLDFVLKLEQGTTSTPYYYLDAATVYTQCARYYQFFLWAIGGYAAGFGSRLDGSLAWPPKRATPSTTRLNTGPTANIRGGDPNTYVLFNFAGAIGATGTSISAEANAAGFTEAYNMMDTAESEL